METKDRIKKIISSYFKVPEYEVKEEDSLDKDFGADSIDIVEIVMEIQDDFGITVGNLDMQNVYTVQDLIDVVEKIRIGR